MRKAAKRKGRKLLRILLLAIAVLVLLLLEPLLERGQLAGPRSQPFQVPQGQDVLLAHQDQPLIQVLELPHVASPGSGSKGFQQSVFGGDFLPAVQARG